MRFVIVEVAILWLCCRKFDMRGILRRLEVDASPLETSGPGLC
jgi:hypothetical protein